MKRKRDNGNRNGLQNIKESIDNAQKINNENKIVFKPKSIITSKNQVNEITD